jgi:hypothetical protein
VAGLFKFKYNLGGELMEIGQDIRDAIKRVRKAIEVAFMCTPGDDPVVSSANEAMNYLEQYLLNARDQWATEAVRFLLGGGVVHHPTLASVLTDLLKVALSPDESEETARLAFDALRSMARNLRGS